MKLPQQPADLPNIERPFIQAKMPPQNRRRGSLSGKAAGLSVPLELGEREVATETTPQNSRGGSR